VVGRNHPLLRRIRAFRRDRPALHREGLVVAEGVHLVAEALGAGAGLEAVVVSPRLAEVPGGADLLTALRRASIEPLVAADEALRAVQDARAPQPVVALARIPSLPVADAVPGRPGVPLVVVADGVQDPGNLGALLRAADAAGASSLLASGRSADLRHPRLVRATMGSCFRLPAARGEPGEILAALAARDIPVLAADPRRGVSHDETDWRGPLALVVGGEGAGLADRWSTAADRFVRIPMREGVESLSVPVAGAVLLFEAARQRRIRPRATSAG
jgi:TrmH family RNA methyltransferase